MHLPDERERERIVNLRRAHLLSGCQRLWTGVSCSQGSFLGSTDMTVFTMVWRMGSSFLYVANVRTDDCGGAVDNERRSLLEFPSKRPEDFFEPTPSLRSHLISDVIDRDPCSGGRKDKEQTSSANTHLTLVCMVVPTTLPLCRHQSRYHTRTTFQPFTTLAQSSLHDNNENEDKLKFQALCCDTF